MQLTHNLRKLCRPHSLTDAASSRECIGGVGSAASTYSGH
jgi:hypothetical protein